MEPESSVSRRSFLESAAVAVAAVRRPAPVATPSRRADPVVRRGNWAGVALQAESRTLFIDPLDDTASLGPGYQVPAVRIAATTPRVDVAVTHLHNDHYDRALLHRLWVDPDARGRLVIPEPLAAYAASDGFRVTPAGTALPVAVGPFVVVALPAQDGWGELQVSYVVDVAGRRFFHGGDTLWHGRWWEYGRLYGPFDVAFLPINGAIIPSRTGTARIPHTLTHEQAVTAAKALGARLLVPIHHGLHDPGRYEEDPDVVQQAGALAARAGVAFRVVAAGDAVPLPEAGT